MKNQAGKMITLITATVSRNVCEQLVLTLTSYRHSNTGEQNLLLRPTFSDLNISVGFRSFSLVYLVGDLWCCFIKLTMLIDISYFPSMSVKELFSLGEKK